MRNFSRALRVDLQRGLFSLTFLLNTVLIFVWLMLCGWTFYTSEATIGRGSVPMLLSYTLIDSSGFLYLLPAVASVGYSWSYCVDKNSGFSVEAQERVGLWRYSASKVISTALTAFLASYLAMGAYLLFLCTYGMQAPVRTEMPEVSYLGFVVRGQDWLYYLSQFLLTGLTCSLWATVALLASAYLPNIYVILFVPVILRYGSDVLDSMVNGPAAFSIGTVTAMVQPFDNAIGSLLWSVEYLLLLIVLCGWLFCRRLRKERGK